MDATEKVKKEGSEASEREEEEEEGGEAKTSPAGNSGVPAPWGEYISSSQ